MMSKLKKVRPTSPPDYVFIGALILIVLFGFVMLASASSDIAKLRFNDSYHYLKQQIVNGLGVGLVGLLFASFLFYRRWERLAMPMLGVSILFLLLVFTPLGFSAKGSARWVDLSFVAFQPGELLKLTFLLYLALCLSVFAQFGPQRICNTPTSLSLPSTTTLVSSKASLKSPCSGLLNFYEVNCLRPMLRNKFRLMILGAFR